MKIELANHMGPLTYQSACTTFCQSPPEEGRLFRVDVHPPSSSLRGRRPESGTQCIVPLAHCFGRTVPRHSHIVRGSSPNSAGTMYTYRYTRLTLTGTTVHCSVAPYRPGKLYLALLMLADRQRTHRGSDGLARREHDSLLLASSLPVRFGPLKSIPSEPPPSHPALPPCPAPKAGSRKQDATQTDGAEEEERRWGRGRRSTKVRYNTAASGGPLPLPPFSDRLLATALHFAASLVAYHSSHSSSFSHPPPLLPVRAPPSRAPESNGMVYLHSAPHCRRLRPASAIIAKSHFPRVIGCRLRLRTHSPLHHPLLWVGRPLVHASNARHQSPLGPSSQARH